MYSHMITPDGLTLLHDGHSTVVTNTHPKWEQIQAAVRVRDYDAVLRLANMSTAFTPWTAVDPEFTVSEGRLRFSNRELPPEMSVKALRMLEAGQDPMPLFRCLRKLLANPSSTCQRAALAFFERIGATIHEDGDFVGFKGVRDDYLDCHSGTISNRVGDSPLRLERWEVDDNSHVLCSKGYHIGSQSYARGFGRRVMVAKFNPADVVSIPSEASGDKCRVTYYEIIAEAPAPVVPAEVYDADRGWDRTRFDVTIQLENGTVETVQIDATNADDAERRVKEWIRPGTEVLEVLEADAADDDDVDDDDDADDDDDDDATGEF